LPHQRLEDNKKKEEKKAKWKAKSDIRTPTPTPMQIDAFSPHLRIYVGLPPRSTHVAYIS
jgi:hypothetical protein